MILSSHRAKEMTTMFSILSHSEAVLEGIEYLGLWQRKARSTYDVPFAHTVLLGAILAYGHLHLLQGGIAAGRTEQPLHLLPRHSNICTDRFKASQCPATRTLARS